MSKEAIENLVRFADCRLRFDAGTSAYETQYHNMKYAKHVTISGERLEHWQVTWLRFAIN